jgi:hypothetical protein
MSARTFIQGVEGDLMNTVLEQFLAPYTPEVRELAWKLRAVIREVMPEAITAA